MRFPVLSSKAVSRQICDKQHQPPLVTDTCIQHVNGKFNVRTTVQCFVFFSDFLSAQNRVRVIEGEFIWKDLRGNINYFELAGGSSYRGVKLQ